MRLREKGFGLWKGLWGDVIGIEKGIELGLDYVENWRKGLGIDLYWDMKEKMK